MNKIANNTFVTLGIIFAILLVVALVLLIVNGTRSDRGVFSTENITDTYADAGGDQTDAHPHLSAAQEAALRSFGIDPSTIPTTISPEQQACFIAKLGETRAAEIKAGDVPTAAEFFTAKACI